MAGSTINNPAIFSDVVKSANVIPGDILTLLDVVRLGEWDVIIGGDINDNIVIKPYEQKATIQGDINLMGDYCRWENIEFCYKGFTTRDSQFADSHDMPVTYQPEVFGENIELYRCLIHDTAGIGFWKDAKNSKLTE